VVLVTKEWMKQAAGMGLLRAFERPVACALTLVARAQPALFSRQLGRLKTSWHTWQGKMLLGAAALLAAALVVPVSYKIRCPCKVQPVTRRFIVAPYDGRLEKTLVEPGDVVSDGDALARMDGRELRWELAGLEAEHSRAKKMRDAALASHNVAGAQQAKLEVERLELRIRLLKNRSDHLEIKSPVAGVVISGDLKNVEGAPLSAGQGLFEIAPLDEMIVEIAVPEEEISHVETGMHVVVYVDAYAGERWEGNIATIFPQSQLRDAQSVFLAELRLDNSRGILRPGMSGQAKITGPTRPLVWNLFHKPYESLAWWLGW
jgi:RND family efflux transporter MFP subunit